MALWQREVIGQHLPERLLDLTHQQTGLGASLLEDPAIGYFADGVAPHVAAVAQRTLDTLRARLGDDEASWQWGRIHQAHWHHPVGDAAFDIGPREVDGGSHTLRNTGGELPPHAASSGAEYRIVVDFADAGLVSCRAEHRQFRRAGQPALPGSVRTVAARRVPRGASAPRPRRGRLRECHDHPAGVNPLVDCRKSAPITYRREIGEHRYHSISRLHVGKGQAKDFDLGLMEFAAGLGDRVLDQDHAIVIPYPASQCCRYTNGGCNAGNDAGRHAHRTEDRVECRILEPSIPFLDDDVLVVQGLEFVGNSRTPRALEKERSIAAGQSGVPMWPRRIGVVRLVRRDDMNDGPPTADGRRR